MSVPGGGAGGQNARLPEDRRLYVEWQGLRSTKVMVTFSPRDRASSNCSSTAAGDDNRNGSTVTDHKGSECVGPTSASQMGGRVDEKFVDNKFFMYLSAGTDGGDYTTSVPIKMRTLWQPLACSPLCTRCYCN